MDRRKLTCTERSHILGPDSLSHDFDQAARPRLYGFGFYKIHPDLTVPTMYRGTTSITSKVPGKYLPHPIHDLSGYRYHSYYYSYRCAASRSLPRVLSYVSGDSYPILGTVAEVALQVHSDANISTVLFAKITLEQ